MDPNLIGPPQVAALAVLVQRAGEQIYASRNMRRLIAAGAREEGKAFYPVVAVSHLAWIASIFFLIPPDAVVVWPAVALFVLLQPVRYWSIAALGRFWTYRIVTLDSAPIVETGPFRWIRHPNYAVSIAETLILPLAFGAVAVAAIMTAVYGVVTHYKITLEDRALAPRRGSL
jgi:methyltransferase